MNIKRQISPKTTQEPMLKANGHLNDAWLLLAIDGELTASDHALLKEHVRACWRCRARKEHLERTIEEIVDYEQALVAPDMPPSVGGRAIFMARLDQLATELGSPSFVMRCSTAVLRTLRLAFFSRITQIACMVFAIIACVYVAFERNTPVVSANELLQRAVASESKPPIGVDQPVAVQRLNIMVNGHKMARTLYRDRTRNREASRVNVSAVEESLAQATLQQSSLSWDDPLSALAYSDWRHGITDERDSVTQENGGLLRLDTTAPSGPIAKASLTVRASDFHAVKENLRLRDDSVVEIAEVS